MIRRLSVIIIGLGFCIVLWNGYQWWSESRVVSFDQNLQSEVEQSHTTSEELEKTSFQEGRVSAETTPAYETGEGIGELTIPKLGKRYPVYYGSDQNTLKKGIGMYDTPYTTSPSEGRHTALAGHRETTFTGLDGLVEGDFIYVTENNIEYEYQIHKIWVTDAEDTSVLVPKSSPTLTLTTRYPFDFIGTAPERFIVQADLVKEEELK